VVFLYARKEVNQCHTNPNDLVPTQAAVCLLSTSNTAPSIRKLWTNNTIATNATQHRANATAVPGRESATDTSGHIPFVWSARSKADSRPLWRSITSARSPVEAATKRAISWLFVSHVILASLPKAVTGGGNQISRTFSSGQRRGASC
jgi:hypothetical protein